MVQILKGLKCQDNILIANYFDLIATFCFFKRGRTGFPAENSLIIMVFAI